MPDSTGPGVRAPAWKRARILAEDQTSRMADIATAAIAAHKVARTVVDQEVGKARRHIKTRKSATTRQRIITAAIELMMEHSNTNFQMREVSDRCHMSKGSIYYYFSDKDELIEEIFDEGSQGMIAAVEDVIAKSDTAYEGLVNLVAEFAHQIRMSNPLVIALAREMSRPSKGGLLHPQLPLCPAGPDHHGPDRPGQGRGVRPPEPQQRSGGHLPHGRLPVHLGHLGGLTDPHERRGVRWGPPPPGHGRHRHPGRRGLTGF